MNTNLNNVIEMLESGIQDLFESTTYKQYLKICSQYEYSANNIVLILKQCPDATLVKSYLDWKKSGVSIKKNEKGIKILVPMHIKKKNVEILNLDGEDKEKNEEYIHYKIGYVFDVSQTNLEKIPTLSKELLTNDDLLRESINDLVKNENNIFIEDKLINDSCKGYYDPFDNSIHIRNNLSDLHTFKTLIHEKAHSILHKNSSYKKEVAEIEAESVAYIVCNAFNFDTSDYSFAYIATYAEDKNLDVLKESLDRIKNTSNIIINWIAANTNLNIISE